MIFIVGIDPGDSTGLALFMDGNFMYAKQGPPSEIMTEVEVILTKGCRDEHRTIMAVERFTSGRSHTTHQPVAQQVIGKVERAAEIYGARMVMQGAADAHAVADNGLLRQLGLLQTSADVGQPDANDANMAVRHALLTLSREYATQFEVLLRKAGDRLEH